MSESVAFKKKKRPTSSRTSTPVDTDATNEAGDDEPTGLKLDELIELRKLKRATGGIDLEKLNEGDKKKRRLEGSGGGSEIKHSDGTVEGGMGGLNRKQDRLKNAVDTDMDEQSSKLKKLVQNDNFTVQTNTVDVDKHMMAYIDAEMAKRRTGESTPVDDEERALDPRDALYMVGDKYRFDKAAGDEAIKKGSGVKVKAKKGGDPEEGMSLTAIPEVDLGIDRKLKNIEDTEKAKRALYEARAQPSAPPPDEADRLAASRYYHHRTPQETDAEAFARAKREAALAAAGQEVPENIITGKTDRERATDDQVLDRFKMRERRERDERIAKAGGPKHKR